MSNIIKRINIFVNYVLILSFLYFICIKGILFILNSFHVSVSLSEAIFIIVTLIITLLIIGFKYIKVSVF